MKLKQLIIYPARLNLPNLINGYRNYLQKEMESWGDYFMKQIINEEDKKSVPIIPQVTLDEMEKFFMKTGVFLRIIAERQSIAKK